MRPNLKVAVPTLAGALATIAAAASAKHGPVNPEAITLAAVTIVQFALGYLAPNRPVPSRSRKPPRNAPPGSVWAGPHQPHPNYYGIGGGWWAPLPAPRPTPSPAPRFTVVWDSTRISAIGRLAASSPDVVAAYDDGLYNNAAEARADYPAHRVATICVRTQDRGDFLDDEPGNVSRGDAQERARRTVQWVLDQHAAGIKFIGVYADGSDWSFIHAEMARRGISTRPLHAGGLVCQWLADPTGHPHIPDGYDGCQYSWQGDRDESLFYTAALANL